jgi:6-phosphogluconolactonase
MSESSTIAAYVGTFEIRGQSAGIEVVRFDASSGGIERGETVSVGNPSHLAIAGGRGLLFAAVHSAMFEGEPGGAVVAFRIDPANGALDRVNHQIMPFPHPNYIIVDRDERLVLATAGLGGGVSAFPIQDGTLGTASANLLVAARPLLELGETLGDMSGEEFLARRATSASPHAVMLDPSNRFAVVMDAGTDRLFLYSVDCRQGTLSLHQTIATKQAGAAPRHAAFHPNGETLYVVNEGSSSVTAYAFDRHDGQLAELATFPAVPAGRERANAMGDIKIDREGRYLYCSNRGDESIAARQPGISVASMS